MRTHHQALKRILDLKESTGELAQWRLWLLKFDFKVVRWPGLYHQAPDAMSRLHKIVPKTSAKEADFDDKIPTHCILGQETDSKVATEDLWSDMVTVLISKKILEAQINDVYCQSVAQLISTDARFTIDDEGVLYRRTPIDGVREVIVLETYLRAMLCSSLYPIIAGKPGTRRMYGEVRQKFYWPLMVTDI